MDYHIYSLQKHPVDSITVSTIQLRKLSQKEAVLLPQITQLVSGRDAVWIQVFYTPEPLFSGVI